MSDHFRTLRIKGLQFLFKTKVDLNFIINMNSLVGSTVLKLNNGLTIPALGLGTWKSKPGEVRAAVEAAINIGYRHIDSAATLQYEWEVGEALKAKMDEVIFILGMLSNISNMYDGGFLQK